MSQINNRILICFDSDARNYIKSVLQTAVVQANRADCELVWWAAKERSLHRLDGFGFNLSYLSALKKTDDDSDIFVDSIFKEWIEEALPYKTAFKQRSGGSIGNTERNTIGFELCEALLMITLVRPTVILIKSGTRNLPKSISIVAKHFGIPVIYTEHGPFPESLYLSPFTVGPNICKHPTKSVRAESIPNIDKNSIQSYVSNYLDRPESAHRQPEFAGVEEWRKKLNLTGNELVIAYTAQKENDANMLLYSPHFKTNAEFLEFLISALEGVENAVILAKPHPSERGALQVPKTKNKVKVIVTSAINVKELFALSSVVATLNSTTGFEALLHGKPVVTGAEAFYNGFGFTFDIKSKNAIAELSTFLKNPEFTETQQLQFEAFLQKILTENIFFVSPSSGFNGPNEYVNTILSYGKKFDNPVPLKYSLLADRILKEQQLRQQLQQPVWKHLVKRIKNRTK